MMHPTVRPWGVAPTPLVPAAVAKALGHLSAPTSLGKTLGRDCKLAELKGEIWDDIEWVSRDCLRELVELLHRNLRAIRLLDIGTGRTLPFRLLDLPFSTRTRNIVSRHSKELSAPHLKFRELLSIPNCGIRSAIEFACVLEAAIASKVQDPSGIPSVPFERRQRQHGSPVSRIEFTFRMLAAYAAGERNLSTLSRIMPAAPMEWPPEIKDLWDSLGDLRAGQLATEFVMQYSVPDLVRRALAHTDRRMRDILNDRVFRTGRPITLKTIGGRWGITRERVRQLELKAKAQLKRLHMADFQPITRRSKTLRQCIGAAVPVSHSSIERALTWATDDFFPIGEIQPEFAGALLLWLAGPYRTNGDWLLVDPNLPRETRDALISRSDERGLITDNTITETLTQFDIAECHHQDWVNHLRDFLRVDGGVIYYKGTILDKVRALIRYHNRPLTVEEMLKDIGSDSVRSVRQRLIEDSGFWRVNKQGQFVIAGTPGYDEYTGITDEILQELEHCGGQASYDHLVKKITDTYGVKENSVVAYLNTPMFTRDDSGIVRVRRSSLDIDVSTDIEKTAACYCTDECVWYWRIEVSPAMMRGSGRLMPNAFAQQLGCNLGDKIEVKSECGPITLSWPLSSATGATIGSVRCALSHYDAKIGDFLFVKATSPIVTFGFLRKESLDTAASNLSRVAFLLGCGPTSSDSEALKVIMRLLRVSRSTDDERYIEIRRLFQARGEVELSEMIPSPSLSVDDYISNMGKLLSR